MKAYLITTGSLFGLLAVAHLMRSIAERSRFGADPWFLLEGPGIGLIGAVLAVWALRLLLRSSKPEHV